MRKQNPKITRTSNESFWLNSNTNTRRKQPTRRLIMFEPVRVKDISNSYSVSSNSMTYGDQLTLDIQSVSGAPKIIRGKIMINRTG